MSLNYVEINARAMNLLLSVNKHTPSIDVGLKAMAVDLTIMISLENCLNRMAMSFADKLAKRTG